MLRFCAVSALVGSPFLVLAFETSSRELFIILCFFAELFIFAGTAPINSLLVTVVPSHLVGAAQGLCIASINILGSFLAPIVVGFLADIVSLRWGLHLCAIALVLSGVGWWATSQRAPFGED
jgi:sugar phosphate permease